MFLASPEHTITSQKTEHRAKKDKLDIKICSFFVFKEREVKIISVSKEKIVPSNCIVGSVIINQQKEQFEIIDVAEHVIWLRLLAKDERIKNEFLEGYIKT